MSNHLAVATVTSTLQRVLNQAVMADVTGAVATAVRPDAAQAGLPAKGVNVYLYLVTPNGALRNQDLPTRHPDGRVTDRPAAALDLHYLFTFYGDESTLEPQRVAGSVIRTLHANPVLDRAAIRAAIQASAFLARSNLVDQVDSVKFTPLALSLEDVSKLWSVLLQTTYAFSVAYVGSVVLIESDAPARESLPVRTRAPYVRPIPDTAIVAVEPAGIAFSPTARVTIVGRSLLGPSKRYRFGDRTGTLVAAESTDERAVVRLPTGVPAGPVLVSVLDDAPLGADHAGFESNAAVLLLQPVPGAPAFTTDPGPRPDPRLVVAIEPPVRVRQRVELVLNDLASGGSWVVPARPRAAHGDDSVFPTAGIPGGTYLYRVRVDGAASELQVDTTDPDPANQPYVGPTVVLP